MIARSNKEARQFTSEIYRLTFLGDRPFVRVESAQPQPAPAPIGVRVDDGREPLDLLAGRGEVGFAHRGALLAGDAGERGERHAAVQGGVVSADVRPLVLAT